MTDEPDEFDIALRKWSAEQGILDSVRKAEQEFGLDPALIEKVEGDITSGDLYALIGTMCECLRAMGKITGKPQPDLVKRMRALRRQVPEDEG
jgi:hypothetical protein